MSTSLHGFLHHAWRSLLLGAAIALAFSTLTWAAAASSPDVARSSDADSTFSADQLGPIDEAAEGDEAFDVTATGPQARASYEAAEREVLGAKGDMVPVGRELGESGALETGWVSYQGMKDSTTPSPIVDNDGDTVGYWINGMGWVSVDRATDPNFDPAEALAESGKIEIHEDLPPEVEQRGG